MGQRGHRNYRYRCGMGGALMAGILPLRPIERLLLWVVAGYLIAAILRAYIIVVRL